MLRRTIGALILRILQEEYTRCRSQYQKAQLAASKVKQVLGAMEEA